MWSLEYSEHSAGAIYVFELRGNGNIDLRNPSGESLTVLAHPSERIYFKKDNHHEHTRHGRAFISASECIPGELIILKSTNKHNGCNDGDTDIHAMVRFDATKLEDFEDCENSECSDMMEIDFAGFQVFHFTSLHFTSIHAYTLHFIYSRTSSDNISQ